jgi:hypothetical protein
MGIESIIERPPIDISLVAGQVVAAIGNTTITDALAGGVWGGAFSAGDLVQWIDNGGLVQSGVVQTANLDTLVLNVAPTTVSSGGVTNLIYQVQNSPDWFIPDSAYPQAVIHAGFDGVGGGSMANDHLETESGLFKIDADEGVLIKSLYIRNPYQFTWADGRVSLELAYRLTSVGGAPIVLTTIGENGNFVMPIENQEVPVNAFVPSPDGITAGDTWEIYAKIGNTIPTAAIVNPAPPDYQYAYVSTVNMPAILEGSIQPLFIGARIIHAATVLT